MNQRHGFNWPKIMYYVVLGITAYIVLVPITMLVYSSVGSHGSQMPFEEPRFSFDNYIDILKNPMIYKILYNSFIFTAGSTILGVTLALLLAWVLERTLFPLKTFTYVLVMIPMAIPHLIYAVTWTGLLNERTGLFNVWLMNLFGLEHAPLNIYTLGGMIFLQGLTLVPTAFLMISATFSTFDPSLEEQSAISGRGTFGTLRRITLPILRPALLSALLYFAVVAVESFEIPGTLSYTARVPILSSQIYFITHPPNGGLPNYGMASVLGMLLLIIALALIWLYQRSTRNAERFITITGKGYRPKRIDLGRWKMVIVSLVWFYIVISVLIPLLLLIWDSLHAYRTTFSQRGFKTITFNAYREMLEYPKIDKIVFNTVSMSVISGIITVILVGLIGWMVVRGPYSRKQKQGLDVLSFLPQAVPAIIIGLSLLFFYIHIPLGIYGTIWILIIGMVTKYIAYGSRSMISAQMQISKDLEEASTVSGASWMKTIRRIIFPLLTPALFNCFIWVAVHALRELSVVIMIYSPNTLVISTTIWNLWDAGSTDKLSVLGVFLILVLGLLFYGGTYAIRKLTRLS